MSRAVALKPDKTHLISILYIKNANKAVYIVVVSSLVFFIIKNTNNGESLYIRYNTDAHVVNSTY
jgi:hypothetical protein